MSCAEHLEAVLMPEAANRDGDLTFDLSELRFMDSAGIHLIIQAAQALATRGRLRLLSPGRTVARVLDLAGLERLPNLEIVGGPT